MRESSRVPGVKLRRRELIVTLVLGFLGSRRRASAQASAKTPRVGYLGNLGSQKTLTPTSKAFLEGLQEMAYVLPAICPFAPAFADAGGLIAYGPDLPDLDRRAAEYVSKILRGAKPGDLPVQRSEKFQLVVNLKTARALRMTVPQSLVLRADRVIE